MFSLLSYVYVCLRYVCISKMSRFCILCSHDIYNPTDNILGTLSAEYQIQSISHNCTTRAIIWFPRMLPDTEVE